MIEFYSVYLLNAALLVAGSVWALAKQRFFSVFILVLLAFHLLAGFKGNYGFFSLDVILGSQLLILAATVSFLGTLFWLQSLHGAAGTPTPAPYRHDSARDVSRYLLAMTLLAVASLIIRMRHGLEFFQTDWSERRSQATLLDSLSNFLGFVIFPAAWVALRKRRFAYLALLTPMLILLTVNAGSRAIVLTIPALILAELVILVPDFKRRIRNLFLVAAAAAVLHAGTRILRGLAWSGIVDLLTSGSVEDVAEIVALVSQDDPAGGESGVYQSFYYVYENFERSDAYLSGATILRALLMFIPGSWVGPDIKPMDVTNVIWYEALYRGMFAPNEWPYFVKFALSGQWGSTPLLVWGDGLLNLGYPGIVLYPILAAAALWGLEKYLGRLSYLGLATLAPAIFVGYTVVARGSIIIGLGYVLYCSVLGLALGRAAGYGILAPDTHDIRTDDQSSKMPALIPEPLRDRVDRNR